MLGVGNCEARARLKSRIGALYRARLRLGRDRFRGEVDETESEMEETESEMEETESEAYGTESEMEMAGTAKYLERSGPGMEMTAAATDVDEEGSDLS
jgi:hypothetical protein